MSNIDHSNPNESIDTEIMIVTPRGCRGNDPKIVCVLKNLEPRNNAKLNQSPFPQASFRMATFSEIENILEISDTSSADGRWLEAHLRLFRESAQESQTQISPDSDRIYHRPKSSCVGHIISWNARLSLPRPYGLRLMSNELTLPTASSILDMSDSCH